MLYLIKTTLVLATLLAIYHLFLEREKMHRFNRFYLLSGLVLAFATPLITVGTVDPVATTSFIAVAPTMISEVQSNIIYETEKGIDWLQFIIYGYGLITLIMFLRFINNIGILLLKSRRNPIVNHNGYKVVLIEDIGLPHTFLNYIFINRLDYESGHVEDELFTHEFAHADQWHSLDIILIELVHVFYWFNPLVYLYKKAIQLNHEFLADEEVVQSILEVPAYQNLLLDKAKCTNQVYLASNLNFQVTKKRLIMMTKPLSKRRNIIYGLMVIPMAIGLVSCFGEYDGLSLRSEPLIKYVGDDKLSVDLIGLTEEQLYDIQRKLSQEGITLNFDKIIYNENQTVGTLNMGAKFNSGTSSTIRMDCESTDKPYGLWANKTTGQGGLGFLITSSDLSNPNVILSVEHELEKLSDYFIDNKRIEYREAMAFLFDEEWKSNHTAHFDYINQSVTFKVTEQAGTNVSYSKPISKSYIDYLSKNKFSVNFTGMTEEQLEETKKEVEREGIFLHYNKVELGNNNIAQVIHFTIEFNGKSRTSRMEGFGPLAHLTEPYGFWINKTTNECGVGHLSPEQNLTKNLLYDKVPSDKHRNAVYFIEGDRATYEEAVAWLKITNQGISHKITKEINNDIYTINLSRPDF